MTLAQALKVTYYWVIKTRQETVARELRIGSEHTLVDWFNFCREVCGEILENDSKQIGGPGKVVEIDESKFGKRKYHKGRRKDGVWVFGGIERDSKECFLESVPDRTAATLIPIIKKHVRPGTTIISDCWKSYSQLQEEGYNHLTVNHSIEFVNKDTGAHTNTIESTWRAVKTSLPRHGTRKSMYDSYFVEYIFRKKYLNSANDQFLAFLECIKTVYNPQKSPRCPLKVLQPQQTQSPSRSTTSSAFRVDHSYAAINDSSDDDFM